MGSLLLALLLGQFTMEGREIVDIATGQTVTTIKFHIKRPNSDGYWEQTDCVASHLYRVDEVLLLDCTPLSGPTFVLCDDVQNLAGAEGGQWREGQYSIDCGELARHGFEGG